MLAEETKPTRTSAQTTVEHVRTNLFENTEKKQIKKQDVEAAEAIYELERQDADAKAKQERTWSIRWTGNCFCAAFVPMT